MDFQHGIASADLVPGLRDHHDAHRRVHGILDPIPAGAEIFIDGKDAGKKTDTVLPLPRSAQPVAIRLQLKGYDDYVFAPLALNTDAVTENATLRPHVKAGAQGFSITYVRAPKGKGAALHRHATEEVFLPIHGRWQVFWLEGDEERTIDLDEGDLCNVPIGIFRGFRNLSDNPHALLIAIVGGPDAGKVDWHPSVVTEARKTGLSVDDDGNLIVEKPAA